jgi:hypothetical protein
LEDGLVEWETSPPPPVQMVEESNMLMHDGMVVSQSVIWLEIGDDNSGVCFFCFFCFLFFTLL